MLLPILLSIIADPFGLGPSKVKISQSGPGFQLLVDGKPFLIKGAGGDASKSLLASIGGNSFRTWGADNLEDQLAEAQKLGLKVTIGIWIGHEEHGFKYTGPTMVAKQYETAKAAILRYKDNPALLMWGIGNEMEGYGAGDNALIWDAVEQIAKFAKQTDPNHPTMTVIAEVGGKKVPSINRYCPDIDVVGINSYGGAVSIADRYRAAGGTKPYVLTEFGPPGVWELPKTSWGATPEPTSTQKAEIYKNVYEKAVLGSNKLCLGSYAFAWGNKQEATATWFGMLLPGGNKLGAVDTMCELWSGKRPANLCPKIESLSLEEPDEMKPGATVHAKLQVSDPEGDPMRVKWVLQRESGMAGVNGDTEAVPPIYPEAILKGGLREAEVRMPSQATGYRLFAYVSDNHGNSAVGNIPLHVKRESGAVDAASPLPFSVYSDGDKPMPFVPAGWMGDVAAIKVDPNYALSTHSGTSCFKLQLQELNGWAGIAWQSPANDWGDKPGGYNLTGAKKLTFWVRGAEGHEGASFGVGLIAQDKKYFDTTIAKSGDIAVTKDWQQITIPLAGKDLTRIKTGFVIILKNTNAASTIYIDDVKFEG